MTTKETILIHRLKKLNTALTFIAPEQIQKVIDDYKRLEREYDAELNKHSRNGDKIPNP